MTLTPGTRIGPYEIAAQIGAGGMGEVYRASDTKLGREVAIKVLPAVVAADPERLARFDREARTLAALNHPNIAAIYGLEESSDTKALVMELVDGPTLAERVSEAGSGLPVDEALAIAKQIVEALEAAHEQGIVHRDLKPANIKLRPDGTVKVLDFGLAKAVEPAQPLPAVSHLPTITTPAMTQAGMILGTAAYMSPEQAKGRAADKRSDVWAFGVVLYEMLTGRRAFPGDDVADVLANVLKTEPDWGVLPGELPATLSVYLKRCLRKEVKERVPDVATMRLALEGAFDPPLPQVSSAVSAAPRFGLSRLLPWAAGVSIGLAVGLAVWRLQPAPAAPVVRFDIVPTESLEVRRGVSVAVSPDGTRIVYAAGSQLYSRVLAEGESVPVRGTEGGAAPFFSPDGAFIGFFTTTELKKVPIGGGIPSTVAPVRNGLRGSWSEDGTIVYGIRGVTSLFRVSDVGGTPEPSTTREAGDRDHDFPSFLPGGRWALFTLGWFPWDRSEIAAASVDTGERRSVYTGGYFPQYVETGHLVFVSKGELWAAPFDLERLQVTSEPVPVVEGVWQTGTGAQFSVSRAGTLAYVPGRITADAFSSLVWVNRATREEEPLGIPPGFFTDPVISPDGTRVAFSRTGTEGTDIWIWNDIDQTQTRLTFGEGDNDAPVWTVDGQRVVFRSTREGGGLFARAADGTGGVERVGANETFWPFAWSATGELLVSERSGALRDVALLAMSGAREAQTLLSSPFDEGRLDLSPDGRWLAYESDESGRTEIYVRPFPDIESGKTQVSVDGGTRPKWSADGRELFYIGPDAMMASRVQLGQSFVRTRPESIFEMSLYLSLLEWANSYDVSPDGRRFLMVKENVPGDGNPPRIRVVEHWFEELKRLVQAD